MSHAKKFIDFINLSPSHFHAVEQFSSRLKSAGYQYLRETEEWSLKPGGKYFFTRNRSTIFAFCLGGKYTPGNGFQIIGAHTDSPVLKVKPHSAIKSQGFLQLGVQLYGGGLWHTWFDRDLAVAGRVILKRGDKFEHELVHVDKPILRIPTLAIHLDREVNEAFKFNKETQLLPVFATEINKQLSQTTTTNNHHHPAFLQLLADQLKCQVSDIYDFELNLLDQQPSTIGGLEEEFIFSGRLDNLMSSYCALEGLLQSESTLSEEQAVRLITLFDNEEVGSQSAYGADSALLFTVLRRITHSLPTPAGKNAEDISTKKSFLISADMAHACHPNYSEKHEGRHRPVIHEGPVVKVNANQRYATTSETSFVIKELARRFDIPVQEFVVRNDSACGSTIGPILSANCGIRTVDLGNPMLSMHSIREMCGTRDVDHCVRLFKAFFDNFTKLDEQLRID